MNKLHTEIIALCDYAIIAQQTNKPSVIGIFTELGVQQFPGGMPQAVLFATIAGATANSTQNLTFKVSNEKGVQPFPQLNAQVTFGANGKTNINLAIGNFVFPQAGEYKFSIYDGKEEIGSTTLNVFQAKQPNQTYEFKQSN